MTELWDLVKQVEDAPDDYELRWRLAKKLYTAWEYRLALEHLQVLKKDWHRRLNVLRYLSATYYRLGRYDEAIEELQGAIESWPKELGIREQLARVYEIAGRNEEAAEVWEEVRKLDPNHPIAEGSIERLKSKRETSPTQDLRLSDSDSGIDLSPGQVCPNCGAQNSDEFDRCWQCHASLYPSRPESAATPQPHRKSSPLLSPETISLLAGFTVVGLLSISIYLSLRMLLVQNGTEAPATILTLGSLYVHALGVTRVAVGVVLLVAWPVALWSALSLMKIDVPVPASHVNLSGMFLAALTYVASWLPGTMVMLAVVLPVALSLIIIAGMYRLGLTRALAVWAVQLVLVTVAGLGAFTISERIQLDVFFNPFTDIPALISYAHEEGTVEEPGVYTLPESAVPITKVVRWHSTGSHWLDRRAGDIEFTVFAEDDNAGLKFEIRDDTGTRLFEYVKGRKWSTRFPMEVNKPYVVEVTGPDTTPAKLVVTGLLRPAFAS
jgi:hypothetical protein